MGKQDNAKLCNALIKSIRTISIRVNDANLATEIRDEARPIFKTIRTESLTFYQNLLDGNIDATDGEWKLVKTMRENIEDSEADHLVHELKGYQEYLESATEDLDPITDNPLGDDDIIDESKLSALEVEVPTT